MKSLAAQGHQLSDTLLQLKILDSISIKNDDANGFEGSLASFGLSPLKADRLEVLQVNLGKMCNLTCSHCHVDAGPDEKKS